MRFQTPVLWGFRCAVCLSLGLAGCTAGGPTRFQAQTPQRPSQLDNGPEIAGDAAGSARQRLAVGSKEGHRPGEAAQPVRLASFSAEGQPPVPDPPDGPTPGAPTPFSPEGNIGGEVPPVPPQGPIPFPRTDDSGRWTPGQSERAGNVQELDLSAALTIVSGQNPQIAFAGQRYREAYARLRAARVLWLPSIHAGVSYNKHEGRLQNSSGRVFDSSRGVLHSGLGVKSVGTGSPKVAGIEAQFHLTDAIFQPRIANRAAAARQQAARATTHDVLLEAALAYLDLLEASQARAIAAETFEHGRELADLTATFARTGQGPQADADRAAAALAVLENEVTRAEEQIEVSGARLCELLHLDPTTIVMPREPTVVPVELVAREEPLAELLATGLSNRPELAESRHLVGEAVHRYRREKCAPLLPSAFLGVSYSGFGGGPGSTIGEFDDRFDFDVAAYWELRNFGFGERAAREQARARYQEARLQEIQVMDRVAREVIESRAQVRARHRQIAVAESGVRRAADSYRRNMERIRAGAGLPIEVLQAIQALDQARREYLRAVVDYNEAQFRLYRALGWPIR